MPNIICLTVMYEMWEFWCCVPDSVLSDILYCVPDRLASKDGFLRYVHHVVVYAVKKFGCCLPNGRDEISPINLIV
jgi:hypothetical protein